MLDLLYKDFKLMFGTNKNISSRIITFLVRIIFIASFIAIEVFLFTSILKRIKMYNTAPIAFMSLFLFIISIMLIIYCLNQAHKLLFNETDIEQLSHHPISNSSIILSKLLFLLVFHYVTCFTFVYPVFISYAVVIGKGAWFYYLGLLYPLLSFLLEMGVALLFVYPYHLLKKFLKKHVLIKFLVSIVILLILVILYSIVLNLFINIISGGNINQLVSSKFLNNLINLQRFEVPIHFLVEAFINRQMNYIIPFVLISGGIFIMGISLAIFGFNMVRNIAYSANKKLDNSPLQVDKVSKALVKKEINLLTKNADYSSSFTALLIIQPFLAFLVIRALNSIFMNGAFAYYLTVVPNFLKIVDIVIMMFFTVMIAQGSSLYISMEKATIKVMKVIPIPFKKQIVIKVMIPFLLSTVSLLISLGVLWISKVINVYIFLISLLMCILLLLAYTLTSLKEELSIKHRKPKNTLISNIISYLIPLMFAGITIALNFIGVNIYLCYFVSAGLFLVINIILFFYLRANLNDLFLDLDMVN